MNGKLNFKLASSKNLLKILLNTFGSFIKLLKSVSREFTSFEL